MVVFDASILSLLLHPAAKAPLDPSTGEPVDRMQEKLEYLVETLERGSREKILIPTPALSEFLILAGDEAGQYLDQINRSSCFRIVDFDQRAAVEAAALTSEAMAKGDKKSGMEGTWAKIKFDRQIVAIGKVEGAHSIYSTDRDIKTLASQTGLSFVDVSDLPDPPAKNADLPFDDGNEGSDERDE